MDEQWKYALVFVPAVMTEHHHRGVLRQILIPATPRSAPSPSNLRCRPEYWVVPSGQRARPITDQLGWRSCLVSRGATTEAFC